MFSAQSNPNVPSVNMSATSTSSLVISNAHFVV